MTLFSYVFQLSVLVSAVFALVVLTSAAPDSAGIVPLPGPGLTYGKLSLHFELHSLLVYFIF